MSNQVVTANFNNTLPAGLSYTLSDPTGIQSSGQIVTAVTSLAMNVTPGLPIDHQYTLKFLDADGMPWGLAKLKNAVGGIIIVENVDITQGNPLGGRKAEKVVAKNITLPK